VENTKVEKVDWRGNPINKPKPEVETIIPMFEPTWKVSDVKKNPRYNQALTPGSEPKKTNKYT
jgi:hypothetical protein